MNFISNLVKKLKKFTLSIMISISLALSRLEINLFKTEKDNISPGSSDEINHIKSDLLRSLYNGEYNQQYVDKFYKILKSSDDIIYKSSNIDLQEKLKKHNTSIQEGNQDLSWLLNNVKPSRNSNPDIIMSIKNNIEVLNTNDLVNNKEPKKLTTIKCRNFNRNFKIEEYTDRLEVRTYKDHLFYLDFYINNDHAHDDFKIIKNIYFIDKYGDLFEYRINEFLEIKNNNFYNKYTFIAEKI